MCNFFIYFLFRTETREFHDTSVNNKINNNRTINLRLNIKIYNRNNIG